MLGLSLSKFSDIYRISEMVHYVKRGISQKIFCMILFLFDDQCLLILIKDVMTKSPNYNIGKEDLGLVSTFQLSLCSFS